MKFKIKIIAAFLLSLALTFILKKEIFIADTPRLKYLPHQYIALKIKEAMYDLKYGKMAKKAREDTQKISLRTMENAQKVIFEPMKKIAPGVYSQTRENVVKITFKEEEMEWEEYKFKVNGKEVKIRVLKGGKIPSQGELEEIFSGK